MKGSGCRKIVLHQFGFHMLIFKLGKIPSLERSCYASLGSKLILNILFIVLWWKIYYCYKFFKFIQNWDKTIYRYLKFQLLNDAIIWQYKILWIKFLHQIFLSHTWISLKFLVYFVNISYIVMASIRNLSVFVSKKNLLFFYYYPSFKLCI